jgi:hypothetical protein
LQFNYPSSSDWLTARTVSHRQLAPALISLEMEQAIRGFDYQISTNCGVSPGLIETEAAVVLDTSAVPTVASYKDMELGATLGVRVR